MQSIERHILIEHINIIRADVEDATDIFIKAFIWYFESLIIPRVN